MSTRAIALSVAVLLFAALAFGCTDDEPVAADEPRDFRAEVQSAASSLEEGTVRFTLDYRIDDGDESMVITGGEGVADPAEQKMSLRAEPDASSGGTSGP